MDKIRKIDTRVIPLTCVKCGSTEIKTRWFEKVKEDNEGGILLSPGPICYLRHRPEHLHRTCSCGYQWCDPVLGAE